MPRKSKEQLLKEAQYKATSRYKKKTYKNCKIELHIVNDADILEILEKVPSKQAFIKECIRKQLRQEF